MDTFTPAYLANLAANLTAALLPALGRRLQTALMGSESSQAVERSLHKALIALLAQASAASPDEETLLADIFSDFLQQEDVLVEVAALLRGKGWDVAELAFLFEERGYDTATLPGLRFAPAMEAFAAAFISAAAAEPTLQATLQTDQLLAQTGLQKALLAEMKKLVALLQNGTNVGIRAGVIRADNVVSGMQIVYQWSGAAPPDDTARNAYLTWLMNERQTLSLRAISGGKTGGKEQPPDLAQVYIALNTKKSAPLYSKAAKKGKEITELEREEKPVSALQALAANQRLVLLGEPGSGKSTFVSHLTYCLAAHASQPEGDWLAQLPDWPAKKANLLPVYVTLRDFARWAPEPLPEKAYPQHLWTFITDTLRREKLEAALPVLEKALADGQVLLLLDGLDEVTGSGQRRFVRDAVLAFARRYAACPLLITCRVLSYLPPDPEKEEEDLRLLPLSAYPVVELAPFDEAQRSAFIQAWYSELKRQGHLPGLDETRLSRDLQQAIRRSDLQRVAGNPLLLTVMAMVHVEEGRLPDSRALLYNKAVDLLLSRWEESKGEDEVPLLRQMLQAANRTDLDLKSRLAQVAFAVHTGAATPVDGEQVSDVGESYLCAELSRLHKKDLGWGQRLLDLLKTRAGLLVERSPGQFAFPHRTFQEYLAGHHLATQPDFVKLALDWARRDVGWWPMLRFAVEHLVHVQERPYDPLFFIAELCPEAVDDTPDGWRQVWLAGQTLLSLGTERAEDSQFGRQLLERARQRLVMLLAGAHLSLRERAEVGQVLAQLGDPRPGVGVIAAVGLPDLVWSAEIPAGTYTIGDNLRPVSIDSPYRIARYPITNSQFQCFVEATDRDDAAWWAGMPEGRRGFIEPRWSYANHPRESVSWYQAIAFCRWLTHKLHEGLLPASPLTGDLQEYVITLPHEYEWEVAARWPNEAAQELTYPWGKDFDADKANTREGDLGQTTAVGIYPSGRNKALDLYDLSGNVWEWCRNKYDAPDVDEVDGSNDWRVLRGGSWIHAQNYARAAYRPNHHPDYPYYGFRVVVRRSPSHHDL